MAKGDRLNPQQRLFAHEYLVDRNATQAAIRAGYAEPSAHSQAYDLLKNPAIRALIDAKLAKIEAKAEIKLETVIVELKRILESDPLAAIGEDGAVLPLSQWPEDLRRALSGIDVEEIWAGRGESREQIGVVKKMRFWSKTHAAEQLMRHLGAFHDRVDVTTKISLAALIEQAEKPEPPKQVTPKTREDSPGGEISADPVQSSGSLEIVDPGPILEAAADTGVALPTAVPVVSARPPVIRKKPKEPKEPAE